MGVYFYNLTNAQYNKLIETGRIKILVKKGYNMMRTGDSVFMSKVTSNPERKNLKSCKISEISKYSLMHNAVLIEIN